MSNGPQTLGSAAKDLHSMSANTGPGCVGRLPRYYREYIEIIQGIYKEYTGLLIQGPHRDFLGEG